MNQLRELIDRYAQAWKAGDLAALRACYHRDFTIHYFGDNPLAGDHVGQAAALRAMGEIARRADRKLLDLVDVLVGESRACVIARERFTRGDLTADVERVLTYAVEDGLLRHCWVYDGDQALIDRFLAD